MPANGLLTPFPGGPPFVVLLPVLSENRGKALGRKAKPGRGRDGVREAAGHPQTEVCMVSLYAVTSFLRTWSPNWRPMLAFCESTITSLSETFGAPISNARASPVAFIWLSLILSSDD